MQLQVSFVQVITAPGKGGEQHAFIFKVPAAEIVKVGCIIAVSGRCGRRWSQNKDNVVALAGFSEEDERVGKDQIQDIGFWDIDNLTNHSESPWI